MPASGNILQAKFNKNNLSLNEDRIDPKEYETKLSPGEEKKFQLWLDSNRKEGKIPEGDYNFYKKNGYGYGYDFRAAYKAGLKPEISKVDNEWHWGDYGKKPNHETFSNQSVHYAKVAKPGIGGHWEEEETYIKNPKIGAPIPPTKDALILPKSVKLKVKKKK
jgi:hypothetical protein